MSGATSPQKYRVREHEKDKGGKTESIKLNKQGSSVDRANFKGQACNAGYDEVTPISLPPPKLASTTDNRLNPSIHPSSTTTPPGAGCEDGTDVWLDGLSKNRQNEEQQTDS